MAVAPVSEERLGFLRNCLVEGDFTQEARVRRNKQRALLVSIIFQILIVAALILFPLFTKGENITGRVLIIPPVPYSPVRAHNPGQTPAQPHGKRNTCNFCVPPTIPPTISMHDPRSPISDQTKPDGVDIPGTPEGKPIPGALSTIDTHHELPPPPPKERLHVSETVIAARLIRRVEPLYPPLAVQIRREGRVELHAIISTDGSIQSLEVVNGDPFFFRSALSAVRQWRYQPTLLDGQPIEVDTHVTVIYTLAH
jgi:periplasmic protein TonB